MPEQAVDHRRAIAERNAAAILDAVGRLAERRAGLSMVSIAAEAGVSRPTLYAHYATLGEVVEAAAERAVRGTLTAFEEARPDDGPAADALRRMVAASWDRIGRMQAFGDAIAEHLPPGASDRTHAALWAPVHELVARGRREGSLRADVPAEWLVRMYFTLIHGAADYAGTTGASRDRALELLLTTVADVFEAR